MLARWKADSNITYIETRQQLSELLKVEEKIDSKFLALAQLQNPNESNHTMLSNHFR